MLDNKEVTQMSKSARNSFNASFWNVNMTTAPSEFVKKQKKKGLGKFYYKGTQFIAGMGMEYPKAVWVGTELEWSSYEKFRQATLPTVLKEFSFGLVLVRGQIDVNKKDKLKVRSGVWKKGNSEVRVEISRYLDEEYVGVYAIVRREDDNYKAFPVMKDALIKALKGQKM